MKKLLLFFLLCIASFIQESAKAVTAYPYPIEFTQPDKTVITILLKGDERVKWAQTSDGYTIMFNSTGVYEYAILNGDGDMVPSGIKANNVDSRLSDEVYFLETLSKTIFYSKSQITVMKQIWEMYDNETLKGTKAFPTTGNRKLVCILMSYSDLPMTKTRAEFDNLFNQIGYTIDGATGSVKDFFLENSYNLFNLTVTVAGPYTAANIASYYGTNTGGAGTDQYPQELVTEAITFANADVDYADFDNDGDGTVDGVYMIYAGYGEEAGAPATAIWAHAWQLAAPVTLDGKTIQRYSCSPEFRSNSGGNITRIGVICHEFGHVLGAPDFYDTDYATGGQFNGTGNWDLQAGGSWNNNGATPAHSNGYTKTVIYSWATQQVITSGAYITLFNAAQNSNSFYRINTATANEYYLCENRQLIGFDAALPNHGMIIYHVNATVASPINAAHPNEMYIVCANAPNKQPTSTPSTYGITESASCPYPGGGNETTFTDATTPWAKSWASVNTAKPITNITENTIEKTITFTFMGGPGCTLPTTQSSEFTSSSITTTTMTVGWTRGDGGQVMVVARAGGPVNNNPTLGTSYTANSIFGSGSQIGAGNYVVYKGTGTSVDITGLSTNITYYYAIYELTTASNCYLMPSLTGSVATTTTPTPPVSNFTSDKTTIYIGESIAFTETATNNPLTYSWTFENGFPATSTDRTTVVTWIVAGTYDISLTVTNTDGSDVETKVNYITVNALPSLPSTNPIPIGTGTISGTYFPLGTKTNTVALYKYVLDASIYTAAEIGGGGKLTKIEWRPSTSRADVRNIQIYVKHTAAATLSASTMSSYTVGATLVYSGTFTPNVAGYFAFNLTGNFIYNGTDNLLVLALVNSSGTPGNVPSDCYYTTAANKHQQWNGATLPTGNGTVNGNRPNIRLTFYVPPSAPTANFAGLDYVLTQDFEGGTIPPSGWVNLQGGIGNLWSINSYGTSRTGSYAAEYKYNSTNAANAWLISSGVSLTAGTTYYIYYWERVGTGYTERLKVTVGTAQTVAGQTTTLQTLLVLTNTSYTQQVTSFTPGSSGTYYFGWNCYSIADQWYLDVDDISIGSYNYTQINTYEGDPVTIYDMSTGSPTVWNWTTTGGIPSVSTSQNITTIYNTTGLYNVSLKAGNLGGTNTKTVNNFVNVIGRTPVSNFIGIGNLKTTTYEPFIPQGGTVSFTDLSTRIPTSWNWTFTNGNPSSSTTQNTSNIRYFTTGSHNVSLTATNATGNNIKTSTGYVHVMGTYNVTNWFSGESMTAYTLTGGSGYLPGHCANSSGVQFTKYAEFYDNSYAGTITGVKLQMLYAAGIGKNVTLTVWDGSTGSPGAILGSQTFVITTFTAGADNTKTFTTPINVTGDFFIGYQLNYDASHNYTTHQFCPYMAVSRSSGINTAWTMFNGTWYTMSSLIGLYSSLSVRPEFTYATIPAITWTGAVSTDWFVGTNWSTGIVPTSSDDVYISSTLYQPHITALPATPATCKNLTINTGATLTIDAGKALTASGTTTVNGTFIIESNSSGTGSFIDNGTVTGNVTVKKYLAGNRWWYLGTPLSNGTANAFGTLSAIASTGNRLFYWNETTHLYPVITNTSDAMPSLRGYSFKRNEATNVKASFTGLVNTGIIGSTSNLTYTAGTSQGFNLVCNPYPSAINWGSQAIPTTGLIQTNLQPTIWYRTNSTFSTYNWTTGIGSPIDVTGIIPAMQAFWVRTAGSTGGLQLSNTTRLHSTQSFYKLDTDNIFRIELQRQDTALDEVVVGFFEGATDGTDIYDSEKMFGDQSQIYTLTSDSMMVVINGLPSYATGENKIIPMGILIDTDGVYELKTNNIFNFDPYIIVYIEDILTGTFQDLRENNTYQFTTGIVNNYFRFRLHFGDFTTDIDDLIDNINIYSVDGEIYINSINDDVIDIYNILGEKIISKEIVKGLNKIELNVITGIYIIQTTTFSKKIFLN
jgi:M6 family metalloprotease-like protein